MTSKLLLSTLATAAVLFGAPAYSADADHAKDKEAHCDPAKDKNCKEEPGHKAGDKHESKDSHPAEDGKNHKDEHKK